VRGEARDRRDRRRDLALLRPVSVTYALITPHPGSHRIDLLSRGGRPVCAGMGLILALGLSRWLLGWALPTIVDGGG